CPLLSDKRRFLLDRLSLHLIQQLWKSIFFSKSHAPSTMLICVYDSIKHFVIIRIVERFLVFVIYLLFLTTKKTVFLSKQSFLFHIPDNLLKTVFKHNMFSFKFYR